MKIILGKQFFTCNSILKELVELAMRLMAPLVAAIVWLGVYPAPVLRRMEAAAENFVTLVQSRAAQTVATAREQQR